jgi:hypothetical protein
MKNIKTVLTVIFVGLDFGLHEVGNCWKGCGYGK